MPETILPSDEVATPETEVPAAESVPETAEDEATE